MTDRDRDRVRDRDRDPLTYARSASSCPQLPQIPTFRRDLIAAGIEAKTLEGRIDFHALRNTFATLLAQEGVSLTLAQKLMRHSDPKLTASIYLEPTGQLCPKVCPTPATTSQNTALTKGKRRRSWTSKEAKKAAGSNSAALSYDQKRVKRIELIAKQLSAAPLSLGS